MVTQVELVAAIVISSVSDVGWELRRASMLVWLAVRY